MTGYEVELRMSRPFSGIAAGRGARLSTNKVWEPTT
jgi:hypothetical protein